MTKYEIIVEELQNRVDAGEITLEFAESVNDLAYERYIVNESTRYGKENDKKVRSKINDYYNQIEILERKKKALDNLYKTTSSDKVKRETEKKMNNNKELLDDLYNRLDTERQNYSSKPFGKQYSKTEDIEYAMNAGERAKKKLNERYGVDTNKVVVRQSGDINPKSLSKPDIKTYGYIGHYKLH